MIKREIYMSRIRPFIGNELIKVLTGIRRSGKSVMLSLIQEELAQNGVQPEQFISLNFENTERNFFPGQRIRHKKNVIFHPQHALAVASERLHRSRKNIVFLNHMFTRPPRSSRRYPLLYGYFRLIYLDMIALAFFLRRNISAS